MARSSLQMYRVSPELHTPIGLGPWGLTLQFNELSGTITRMSGPGSRAGPGVPPGTSPGWGGVQVI